MDDKKQDLSKLSQLSQDAKILDQDQSFMDAGTKVKKSRGRPRKDDSQKTSAFSTSQAPKVEGTSAQETIVIPSKEIAKPVIKVISSVGESLAEDSRARMSSDEIEACSEALGLVLDKYAPKIMKDYGPEMVLGITLGQYGLRILALKKMKQEEMKANREAWIQSQLKKEAQEPIPDLPKSETFNFQEKSVDLESSKVQYI